MGNWWHVKNWFRVGKKISWKLNLYTLNGFLYLYKPFQNDFNYNQSLKKHDFIINYLQKDLSSIIEKYKNIEEPEPETDSKERYIWTLWWQGLDNAPALVKACIKSIEEHANGAKVIVITKDNYNHYISLPNYIYEKREQGFISFAQLSDIFRYSLLKQYGGLWLDSTIFTSQDIPESYFKMPIFTPHTKWSKTCFVQHNLYHGFIVGSPKNGKLANFMSECFLEYWKKHDTLIDYLMIDYLIYIAYLNFEDIHSEIEALPYSSERLYDLVNLLNKPYEDSTFKELCQECIFSKLDWHRSYKKENKGEPTFYNKLITN